ncbi:VOC family protein [Mucilaginibacter sp. SG564]|uniref:VOC family protein n=1 Tax=Mucilaginibacter sp. SG564 TaxID=2587022 RepID=UPI001557D29F|nr:VOC family protein [Mucilaginibacter sp. SG564]NOW94986.1 methylmalonyl-CoA/ethylmalonyl-CoA epimerase [Mucilaginibacter sp. SG564]
MKFHHLGLACKNIAAEIASIRKIHNVTTISPIIFDPEQNAELVLLTLTDGTRIELIAGKQVESFVRKNITYYHICFEVDDIHAEIKRLIREHALLISPPKPALLFNSRKVAFLHVSYGLIELLNSK